MSFNAKWIEISMEVKIIEIVIEFTVCIELCFCSGKEFGFMKRRLVSVVALSLALSVSLPNITVHASTTSPVTQVDISEIPMENAIGLNYVDSIGYYLEKEIPQGLEFVILGNDLPCNAVTFSANGSDYYNPSTPISKVAGSRTLSGVWWGGIVQDIFVAGAVAATTIAKSDNTQSKASVKPGLTAGWVSSDWKDTDVRADVLVEVGIAGNKAKWDLQAK